MQNRLACVMALVCGISAWSRLARAEAPSCPKGQRPTLSGCRGAAPSVRTLGKPAPTSDASKAGGAPNAPTAPPSDVARRPEPLREARRETLLIGEIAQLERLVAATPRTATDWARLVLRLADDYAELARAKQRELTEREIAAESVAPRPGEERSPVPARRPPDRARK